MRVACCNIQYTDDVLRVARRVAKNGVRTHNPIRGARAPWQKSRENRQHVFSNFILIFEWLKYHNTQYAMRMVHIYHNNAQYGYNMAHISHTIPSIWCCMYTLHVVCCVLLIYHGAGRGNGMRCVVQYIA
jgi:hypothetical protein